MSDSRSSPDAQATPGDWDAHRELFELTRAFRLHLSWQERLGRYGAVDGPTRRPDDVPAMAAPADASAPQAAGPPAGPTESSDSAYDSRSVDVSPREEFGVDRWSDALDHLLSEETPRRPVAPGPPVAPTQSEEPSGGPRLTLAEVRAQLGDCQRCKLARTRTHIVFGVGDPNAALMFIGEGPGEQEDRRGEPFVGPAGQLLDRMIAAMGWSRDTVYIANVVKCRPPGNRDPEPDEVAACQPFLARQIAAVQPRVIVTLGRPAAHLVLNTRAAISKLRGHFQRYDGIPVMPTYHPAYLLRNRERKGDTWKDLQQVIGALRSMGVDTPMPPRG